MKNLRALSVALAAFVLLGISGCNENKPSEPEVTSSVSTPESSSTTTSSTTSSSSTTTTATTSSTTATSSSTTTTTSEPKEMTPPESSSVSTTTTTTSSSSSSTTTSKSSTTTTTKSSKSTATASSEPEGSVPETIGGYGQRAQLEREIAFANEVFELTNKEREKAGLPKFKKMDILTELANVRAWENTVSYGHTRPDGSSCFTIFGENGLSYRAVGENLAVQYKTPEQAVKAWMNSPGHRENILSEKYEYMGVGFYSVSTGYGTYYSQLFYTPL